MYGCISGKLYGPNFQNATGSAQTPSCRIVGLFNITPLAIRRGSDH